MISSEHCQQYAVLLRIRQKAARRDSIFLGSIWGLGLVAAIVNTLINTVNIQSAFLPAALLFVFGIAFAYQLARLEMFRQSLEMLDFLHRESQPD